MAQKKTTRKTTRPAPKAKTTTKASKPSATKKATPKPPRTKKPAAKARSKAKRTSPKPKVAKKPAPRQTAPKKAQTPAPKPGTTLTRTFKGKEIKVQVTKDGFVHDGKTYRSLTALALVITGYKAVSGPRFFGLAHPNEKGDA